MNARASAQSLNRRGVLAVFFLSIFLALQALAIAPRLHLLVHNDAASADHHCAVTLISHGQFHAAAEVPVVEPPVFDFAAPAAPVESSRSTPDFVLLPVRGPPSLPA